MRASVLLDRIFDFILGGFLIVFSVVALGLIIAAFAGITMFFWGIK
jgi:hypothetical protein